MKLFLYVTSQWKRKIYTIFELQNGSKNHQVGNSAFKQDKNFFDKIKTILKRFINKGSSRNMKIISKLLGQL